MAKKKFEKTRESDVGTDVVPTKKPESTDLGAIVSLVENNEESITLSDGRVVLIDYENGTFSLDGGDLHKISTYLFSPDTKSSATIEKEIDGLRKKIEKQVEITNKQIKTLLAKEGEVNDEKHLELVKKQANQKKEFLENIIGAHQQKIEQLETVLREAELNVVIAAASEKIAKQKSEKSLNDLENETGGKQAVVAAVEVLHANGASVTFGNALTVALQTQAHWQMNLQNLQTEKDAFSYQLVELSKIELAESLLQNKKGLELILSINASTRDQMVRVEEVALATQKETHNLTLDVLNAGEDSSFTEKITKELSNFTQRTNDFLEKISAKKFLGDFISEIKTKTEGIHNQFAEDKDIENLKNSLEQTIIPLFEAFLEENSDTLEDADKKFIEEYKKSIESTIQIFTHALNSQQLEQSKLDIAQSSSKLVASAGGVIKSQQVNTAVAIQKTSMTNLPIFAPEVLEDITTLARTESCKSIKDLLGNPTIKKALFSTLGEMIQEDDDYKFILKSIFTDANNLDDSTPEGIQKFVNKNEVSDNQSLLTLLESILQNDEYTTYFLSFLDQRIEAVKDRKALYRINDDDLLNTLEMLAVAYNNKENLSSVYKKTLKERVVVPDLEIFQKLFKKLLERKEPDFPFRVGMNCTVLPHESEKCLLYKIEEYSEYSALFKDFKCMDSFGFLKKELFVYDKKNKILIPSFDDVYIQYNPKIIINSLGNTKGRNDEFIFPKNYFPYIGKTGNSMLDDGKTFKITNVFPDEIKKEENQQYVFTPREERSNGLIEDFTDCYIFLNGKERKVYSQKKGVINFKEEDDYTIVASEIEIQGNQEDGYTFVYNDVNIYEEGMEFFINDEKFIVEKNKNGILYIRDDEGNQYKISIDTLNKQNKTNYFLTDDKNLKSLAEKNIENSPESVESMPEISLFDAFKNEFYGEEVEVKLLGKDLKLKSIIIGYCKFLVEKNPEKVSIIVEGYYEFSTLMAVDINPSERTFSSAGKTFNIIKISEEGALIGKLKDEKTREKTLFQKLNPFVEN